MSRFVLASWFALAATVAAQDRMPLHPDDVRAPARGAGPVIACAADELVALRAAFADGASAVVSRVAKAERALALPVEFPPRGGQHNQWYQCDDCQLGLETVDATHHRCPSCARIYTGPPYDDVVFSRVHNRNLTRALDAAWAFALTDDRRFAADAAAILLGYAQRYESYPYHVNAKDPTRDRDSGGHLKEQTLSEASMLVTRIGPAYDLVARTLGDAERREIEDHLIQPLVRNVAKCRRGKSNWQTWHNAAMFVGGALIGDADWMRRSVFDPRHGLLFQLEHSVNADGMWYENSWGYHVYTLRALVAHAEAARRCGIDLWGIPALRSMCAIPVRYRMPDGRLPRLGDDVGVRASRLRPLLEAAAAATGDADFAAAVPEAPSWESLMYGRSAGGAPSALRSALFPAAGHAILRDGESAAVLSFGPHGGFHGHFDKLSFVWYAHGRELGVDPGRAASQAYRLPIHARWYRATLGHNTVVVDGRSQDGAAGELLLFRDRAGWAAAAARCDTAYAGVEHARCLVLFEDLLVVLDELDAGERVRRFDWVCHARGDTVVCDAATGPGATELGLAGEEFVTVHRSSTVDDAVAARFPGEQVTTVLHLVGAPRTTVHIGHGPGASVLDRVPLLIATRHGAHVRFAAVLEATVAGTGDPVVAVEHQVRDASSELLIRRRAREIRVVWDGAGEITVE